MRRRISGGRVRRVGLVGFAVLGKCFCDHKRTFLSLVVKDAEAISLDSSLLILRGDGFWGWWGTCVVVARVCASKFSRRAYDLHLLLKKDYA